MEQSQDASVISESEIRRIIPPKRLIVQTLSLLFAQTEFGRTGITQTYSGITALKINTPHVSSAARRGANVGAQAGLAARG